MIKAVLFDLGGTLHICKNSPEREARFADKLISRLGEYGIILPVTPGQLAARLKITTEEYKAAVEHGLCELPAEIAWNDYYLKDFGIGRERLKPIAEELSFLYDYLRPMNMRRPELYDALDALQAAGIRMGVISNMLSKTLVPHFLAEYDIERYFEIVLTSSGTGIRKPDPGIFRIAEEKMQLKPEELCYVGDTLSRDVRGTRNAGWKTVIRIESPAAARRDRGITDVAPDYSITSLMEIPEIIAKENASC